MTLLINEEVEIPKSLEEVQGSIFDSNVTGFKIKQITSCRYKFLANISVGTMIVTGGGPMIEGIKLYGELCPEGSTKTLVKIKSRLRPELYFILVVWLVVMVSQLQKDSPDWLVWGVFPFVCIWFWMVYRVQENLLLKKVKRHLSAL